MSNNPFANPNDPAERWPEIRTDNLNSNANRYLPDNVNSYVGKPVFLGRNWAEAGDYFPGGGNFRVVPRSPVSPVPPTSYQSFQPTVPTMSPTQQQQQQQPPQQYIHPQPTPQAYVQLQQQPQMTYDAGTGTNLYSQQQPQQHQSYYDSSQVQSSGYINPQLGQFDPYVGGASQSWTPPQSSYAQHPPSISSNPNQQSYGRPHPRDFIRDNKASLEAWDEYSWKQLLNAVEALKHAWEQRSRQLQLQMQQSQGYGYTDPTLQQMAANAQNTIDSTSASFFQMKEVYQGYNVSQDASSRKRVREALNASVSSLPDWP